FVQAEDGIRDRNVPGVQTCALLISGRDPAPAVTRSLRILTLLAEASGRPLTLSDIARALGLAKSSAANLCLALEQGEMIQRTAEIGRAPRRGGAAAREALRDARRNG